MKWCLAGAVASTCCVAVVLASSTIPVTVQLECNEVDVYAMDLVVSAPEGTWFELGGWWCFASVLSLLTSS